MAISGLIYIGAFDLVGYAVGPAALARFERVALPPGALVALATVALVVFLIRNAKREMPGLARGGGGAAVAARLDGLLAGVIALLATNGIVGVASFAARLLGHAIPLDAEELGTSLRLLLGGPVFLLAASILGAVDEHLGTARLPWARRSAILSLLPLALTLLLALPLAGRGLPPLATRHGDALARVRGGPRRAPPARRAPAAGCRGLTRGRAHRVARSGTPRRAAPRCARIFRACSSTIAHPVSSRGRVVVRASASLEAAIASVGASPCTCLGRGIQCAGIGAGRCPPTDGASLGAPGRRARVGAAGAGPGRRCVQ